MKFINLSDFMNNNFDNEIAKFFFRLGIDFPFLDDIFITLSSIANFGFIFILVSICLLFNKNTRFYAYLLLGTLLLTFLINDLIFKNIFSRNRPFLNEELLLYQYKDQLFTYRGWKQSGHSFPSGHSAISFSMFSVILTSNIYFKDKRKKILPYSIILGILAALIATSRLYLLHHYFTDILMGGFLGILVGIGSFFLINFLYNLIIKKINLNKGN